jgi:hypothetical protein
VVSADKAAPLGEFDARLLRELRRRWPGEHFDEVNIATSAPTAPDLLGALDFLDVKLDRRRRALSHASYQRVADWLD